MNEIDTIKAIEYNRGIDTAIALVQECMDYEDRMTGKSDTILSGLEACKKKIDAAEHESWCACSKCRGIE